MSDSHTRAGVLSLDEATYTDRAKRHRRGVRTAYNDQKKYSYLLVLLVYEERVHGGVPKRDPWCRVCMP